MAVDFDFVDSVTFRMGDGEEPLPGRRRSFRAIPAGLKIRIHGEDAVCAVNDISAGGICMSLPAGKYGRGDELTMDLLITGKVYLQGVSACVVRRFAEECACAFSNLNRNQERRLDKLVLEMQKRFIVQRKQEREAEEKRDLEARRQPPERSTISAIKLQI